MLPLTINIKKDHLFIRIYRDQIVLVKTDRYPPRGSIQWYPFSINWGESSPLRKRGIQINKNPADDPEQMAYSLKHRTQFVEALSDTMPEELRKLKSDPIILTAEQAEQVKRIKAQRHPLKATPLPLDTPQFDHFEKNETTD